MRELHAVIGANFGDEGKGRCVDYLAHRIGATGVGVRHNSGAQAGHTVEMNGKRHIFSHFSSATFRGWPTLLTHKFVVFPNIFNAEYKELVELGHTPEVYVDARCIVATPYDAFINQLLESVRRDGAHGSCGVGFGQTWERFSRALDTTIYAGDPLITQGRALTTFALSEVERLGIDVSRASEDLQKVHVMMKAGTFNFGAWLQHFLLFKKRIVVLTPEQINDRLRDRNVIFEGAQGLLLHEKSDNFPHVTRCRTGLEDVVEVMSEHQINEPLRPWFTTRAYITKHGSGPLLGENPGLEEEWELSDPTNVPNRHQGSLRFARFSAYADLKTRIVTDVKRANAVAPVIIDDVNIAISCCDQVPLSEFGVAFRAASFASGEIILGWGPDSADTEEVKRKRIAMGSATQDAVEIKAPEETQVEEVVATDAAPAAETETAPTEA